MHDPDDPNNVMTGSTQLRIIVLGYIIRCPLGGMAWHYLQYVLGLQQLGHDVCFLEDSGDEPWACYDPSRGTNDTDPSYGLSFAGKAFGRLGMGTCWAYYDAFRQVWHGPRSANILDFCSAADVMINLSGSNCLRPWTAEIPSRVYVDTDPVFTQIRNLADETRRRRTAEHNSFFTFGENVTNRKCGIPVDGFPWQPTRQPVVLDSWPVVPGPVDGPFTTVMQWDNAIQSVPRLHGGRHYGRKSDSFEPYANLPQRCPARFALAIGGAEAPGDRLRGLGWNVLDPLELTRDPFCYREFVQDSMAEFSVAKEGYVSARSGWFSERSAAYLASGRPVVVQDTGFTDWLEADGGVVAFTNPDEALAGLQNVMDRYEWHCREARRVARDYFDANGVLRSLLQRAVPYAPASAVTGQEN